MNIEGSRKNNFGFSNPICTNAHSVLGQSGSLSSSRAQLGNPQWSSGYTADFPQSPKPNMQHLRTRKTRRLSCGNRKARRAIVLAGIVVALVCGTIWGADEATAPDFENAALLVIDIQAFYFPEGLQPLVEPEAAAKKAAEVIALFRGAGRPVIHIQHLPKGIDTPDPVGIEKQYRIDPAVLPAKGEIVIGKHHANSFRDTELQATLHALGIEELVILGMQTQMCVEAAVRAAADLEFKVTVVHDACATRDLEFGGTTVPAGQVHAAALAAMQSGYARIVSSAELRMGG